MVVLRDVIDTYRELREGSRPISDSSNEHYMLRRLAAGLGERDAMALTPHDLVAYCQMRMQCLATLTDAAWGVPEVQR